LIQPSLRRVKPSADQSSPSDRHRHWPPTQLHSHHRQRPHRHARTPLPHRLTAPAPDPRRRRADSAAAARSGRRRPIWPSSPDLAAAARPSGRRRPIQSPPRSHRRHTDQAAAMSIRHRQSRSPQHRPQRRHCCLSACGISGCGHVLSSLREAFNLLLLSFCFT
jgi:hypothetical protein